MMKLMSADAKKAESAGAVERQGNVVARVIPNVQSKTLVPFVQEKVLPGSLVYTDELPSYNSL